VATAGLGAYVTGLKAVDKTVDVAKVVNKLDNAVHLKLEYFEIASEKTLKTAYRKTKNKKYRAFIAVFAGNIRLIDNMTLN
jgi:pantoate--beta-alanine ligase